MKRYISILLVTVAASALASCSSWFDVSPKTDVKAELLFNSESGFESALTGLYVKMTENNSYGKAFTMEFMSRLEQRYDNISDANKTAIYTYNESNSAGAKSKQAAMWMASYNIIANANNMLKWMDIKGEEVLPEVSTRNRMRGEALAVRAMVHFDLLRCWGPMYRSDSTAKSIPYRLVIDSSRQPYLPANEVVDYIIADLKQAEELLAYQEDTPLSGILHQNMRYRFSLHSVRALMARVLNYRNDKDGAYRYAKMAIDGSELELANDQTLFNDPALFCETLFGLSYYDMSNLMPEWTETAPESAHSYILRDNLRQTYDLNENDARYRNNLGFIHFNDMTPPRAISRKYVRNQNLVPLIRLAEMYYILCESAPLETAHEAINMVYEARGLNTTTQFSSEAARIDALDSEYLKEFYAEGQYFPFLKLHERTKFLNCPASITMTKNEYVFPLPDGEIEYGWGSADSGSDDDSQEDDDNEDEGGSDADAE